MLSIVRVRPLVWFRALFVHGGVRRDDDYLLFTHTHTQNGGRAHKGGGALCRRRGIDRDLEVEVEVEVDIDIDRSIDRSRAWVGGCVHGVGFAWVSHFWVSHVRMMSIHRSHGSALRGASAR